MRKRLHSDYRYHVRQAKLARERIVRLGQKIEAEKAGGAR